MVYSTKIPEQCVSTQETEENLHLRVETLQNCNATSIDSTTSGGAASKGLATAGESIGRAAGAAARRQATHSVLEGSRNGIDSYSVQGSQEFAHLPLVCTTNSLYLGGTLEKDESRPYVHRG